MMRLNSNGLSLKSLEDLPKDLFKMIKRGDRAGVKQLLLSLNVQNIAYVKNMQSSPEDEFLPVKGATVEYLKVASPKDEGPPLHLYETRLWNPVLYAIYRKKTDIVQMLLSDFSHNFIMSQRLPPPNDMVECVIPYQKNNLSKDAGKSIGRYMSGGSPGYTIKSPLVLPQMPVSKDIHNMEFTPQNQMGSPDSSGKQGTPLNPALFTHYSPSDARIECFGLDLTIKNRDIITLQYLWEEHEGLWEEKHFGFVVNKLLEEDWDEGMETVFRSQTSKLIFKSLNAEDKDNFLNQKIIDKVVSSEYWENSMTPIKVNDHLCQKVITLLSEVPYGGYAVLKYPGYFEKYGLMGQTLALVTSDDVVDFLQARKENLRHFTNYYLNYQGENHKLLKSTNKKLSSASRAKKLPHESTPRIIQLIKGGSFESVKDFFEKRHKGQNMVLLEQLNLMNNFDDGDYAAYYRSNVQYEPPDETFSLLLQDGNTLDWNPAIFAIFYRKIDVLKYFCEHNEVFIRNCLLTPFLIETEEDGEFSNEEKFVQEKTEIFCLVLPLMIQDAETFQFLWNFCSYIWNEVHMVLLTNYLFDSVWKEGIKVFFDSPNTKQIFAQMSLFEKERYLKFCEKSINKIPNILPDFRQSMSYNPYNAHYLPIIAPVEEMAAWNNEKTKEDFISKCRNNLDEWSYKDLCKSNQDYVAEFISTAPQTVS